MKSVRSNLPYFVLAAIVVVPCLPNDVHAAPLPGQAAVSRVAAVGLTSGLPRSGAVSQEGGVHEDVEDHEEAEFLNELALIVAGTYEDLGAEDTENYFTIGAKYQREVTERVAVAGMVEYLNDKPAALLVFPVHFLPWKGLDLFAGPGVEFSGGEEEEHGEEHDEGEEHGESNGWDAKFLIRVGIGYVFEIGERYSLAPGIALDFIGREQALVYGVDFSVSF
jgi:hypothetical protein